MIALLAVAALALTPLQKQIAGEVDARLEQADPRTALSRFLNYPACFASGKTPTANPSFWAKDVDFSCASPWNSGGGSLRAGTLISKRHILLAQHFPLWKDVRILFVDNEGNVCPCYVEATKGIAKSDAMVGLLNAEVTPNIHPAKILPDDFARYVGSGEGLPVVTFNRKEEALVTELNGLPTNGAPARVWNRKPRLGRRAEFRTDVIVGDSGNPAFLVVGREPILLYCLHTGGAGAGPWVHLRRREIQAAMDELCPGYKLEEFDFTNVGGEGQAR